MSITVRHAVPSDYLAYHRACSAPHAAANTLQLPLVSPEVFRKRLESPQDGDSSLVACTEEDEVVGVLGLRTVSNPRRKHVASIGMAVRDDWQGQGVGTALMAHAVDLADNWLNVIRLELTVYTDNAAAIALYTKFGFENEGTHRAYAFRGGQYIDAYAMARMKP